MTYRYTDENCNFTRKELITIVTFDRYSREVGDGRDKKSVDNSI